MPSETCPGCHVHLNVPRSFRRGRCPGCGALLTRGQRAPRKPRSNPALEAPAALARPYKSFHGVQPRKVRSVAVTLPKSWWLLGDLHGGAIEYVPPGNSQRADAIYRHSFGDLGGSRQPSTAKLYVSPDGKTMLIRGNFKVSGRGIVG